MEMDGKSGQEIDKATSPGKQQGTAGATLHEQEQKTPKKKPLPSEETLEAIRQIVTRAGERNYMSGSDEEKIRTLSSMLQQQIFEEKKNAEKLTQARAKSEGPSDQEEGENEEEFPEDEESESEPEKINVEIGGKPAKTAALTTMNDLVRSGGTMQEVTYESHADGVIDVFRRGFHLPYKVAPLYENLYESLILPTGDPEVCTIRELFDDISELLQKHVVLPKKDCSLVAYWAIATWFSDYLSFVPSIVLSGPESIADLLLRTLGAVCRRPILLGELSPAILRKLPIQELTPTLLIREPQLNQYLSALINASNQSGYLFFNGKTFRQFYCPKCIYVGEYYKDSSANINSVHINLSGSALKPHNPPPTYDVMTRLQNQLFTYRLLKHDKVQASSFRVSGFRPETSTVADVLAAAIVDDEELQNGIMDVLKDHDEQSRVDRATGVKGLVLRAVLAHCHQKDEKKFVREIADTINGLYAADREPLKISSEKVGHALKYLGLYTCRLGNAGRGLVFDKVTQEHAHRLCHVYDVLTFEPTCKYCHGVQQPQLEEVVHGV
jgi:hypothetical protein